MTCPGVRQKMATVMFVGVSKTPAPRGSEFYSLAEYYPRVVPRAGGSSPQQSKP